MAADQHAYCLAHGVVNVLRDFVAFIQDSAAKEFTPASRRVDAELFPDLQPNRHGVLPALPWVADKLKIAHFELMLQGALVPCDIADGRIKSAFKTKTSAKSDAKPELQKGVKFAHVMLYVGELGKFALEFVAPRTPQRGFCFDLIDFMVRGVA